MMMQREDERNAECKMQNAERAVEEGVRRALFLHSEFCILNLDNYAFDIGDQPGVWRLSQAVR